MELAKVSGAVLCFAITMVIGQTLAAQVKDDLPTEEAKSTLKIDQVDGTINMTMNGEDVDQILTNNKLRAESGSKSRWSLATSVGYSGGSIAHPFGDQRPNITAGNGISAVTDIEGGVSMKYNFSTRDSLILGETVRFVTPWGGVTGTPNSYRGQKFDNFNPGLSYQRIYKVLGFQSYFQVGPTLITQSDYTKIGYLGNFGIYNASVYDIGHSRFSLGLETGASYSWFRQPQAYPEVGFSAQDTREASSDLDVFIYPYLEYKISDTLNLRTVCMWFQGEHTLAAGDYGTWKKDTAQQSVGLGISVSRDVFLYPNVQFIPDQLRPNQTNVALATNINIF